MFQLEAEEYRLLRFQIGIIEKGRHSKYLPYAFTEQGIAMLSSVLHSERAISVNIAIMRAFVSLKSFLLSHEELGQRLDELESRVENHDEQIQRIFDAIRKMMAPESKPVKKIGFCTDE